MDREYRFTLTEEEYLNFLRYRFSHAKNNRGKRLWITTGIPALVVCSLIFFKLYHSLLWNCFGMAVILIWVLVFSPDLWENFIKRRINSTTLKNLKITGFQEVSFHFGEQSLCYTDSAPHQVAYSRIAAFAPIPEMFVFSYSDRESLLLPYRVFGGQEELKQFVREFETCWGKVRSGPR